MAWQLILKASNEAEAREAKPAIADIPAGSEVQINIDLPENKEVATKFKAAGSSLFINPIVDGQDNIKEDTQVWRLVSNEQRFISYLSDKIKTLL